MRERELTSDLVFAVLLSLFLPLFTASCSLGAAWSSIELTAQHLKDRIAFGKPLAEQQVKKIITTLPF